MPAAVFGLVLGGFGFSRGIAFEQALADPRQDFVFVEFEPYAGFEGKDSANRSDASYRRYSGQLSFPAGKAWGHDLFGSFKSTVMDRGIAYGGEKLSHGPLQRYWLSGGAVLLDKPGQSAYFMAGLGLNSDMADLGSKDWNSEWIYIHSFESGSELRWGVGLDVQVYFGKFVPYPLVFMDWRFAERFKLKWDADFLETQAFVTPALAVTTGVRFNLEFFALKDDGGYEYNSLGLEAGVQYSLGGNFYARLKYKELVWGRETLDLPDGSSRENAVRSGRSLRLNFAYGN
jgi:hypothetical protein